MMVGKCLHNAGSELDRPSRGLYYTREAIFHLVIGKSYPIYGMSIFNGGLTVLVRDETGAPGWYPSALFDIPYQALPTDWEFALVDGPAASGTEALGEWGEGKLAAISGFRELVNDLTFTDRLIECDPDALRTFEQLATRMRDPERG